MPLLPEPRDVVAVHEATNEFEAMTICNLLESNGLRAMARSRVVPGYGVPMMAGDQAGIWADILVLREQEAEARRIIAEYLAALEAVPAEPVPEESEPA